MGLDNGIIVKNVTREQLPQWIRYPFDNDYDDRVDICYWRKWWGLRNWFLREAFPNRSNQQYEYKLTVKEVTILWRIVIHYLKNRKDFNEDNNFWEFDRNIRKILYDQRWNLTLLLWWMRKHPEAEVYFYDSY